jgi:hypothetical protein
MVTPPGSFWARSARYWSSAFSTTVSVARAAIFASIAATISESWKRSIWSTMTLVSATTRGFSVPEMRAPWPSSISSTAMSPAMCPPRLACSSRAEVSPWLILAVDWFVNTVMPCARSAATSIFVVVDFPLDPVTMMRPSGKLFSVRGRNPGAILLTTRPGTADPPPGFRHLASFRTTRPRRITGA